MDEPAPGDVVPRSGFAVRGWSAWGDHPAGAVAVSLNGVVVARGLVGSEPRSDVARHLGDPELAGTGWLLHVEASALDAGPSELSVRVWGDPWDPPLELDRFTVGLGEHADGGSVPEFVGCLDRPAEGERVKPCFPVSGWLAVDGHPVSELDVRVDGKEVARARLGLPRVDVARERGGSEFTVSGFEQWIDLSTGSELDRDVALQLVARRRGGQPTVVFERTVHVSSPPDVVDRSARKETLRQRWQRVLSSIDRKTTGDVSLAVFTHRLDYGGGQLWLEEFLARSGAGSRYPCRVITFCDGPLRQRMEARGIEVHVTGEPSVDDIENHEGRIGELAAYLAPSDHNVVLANTATTFSGVEVAQRLGLPVVWAIHESLPPEVLLEVAFGGRAHPDVRVAFFDALRSADAVVFEAEATRRMYEPWCRARRSIVVPYGIDTAAIDDYCRRTSRSAARADVGVPEDSRMILVMGTVEPRKAQTTIAQALRFVRTVARDWLVVFVGGSDSAYCDAVRTCLEESGLAARARVEPVDADAYRWYRAADVLLSASDMESLPRSMLEAMCFGVPVVSTAVFGVPDLLDDGGCGVLFEPNDLDATVDALDEVLALDDAALRALGEAGRQRVRESYDSAGYATDLTALCGALVKDRDLTPGEILARWGRESGERG